MFVVGEISIQRTWAVTEKHALGLADDDPQILYKTIDCAWRGISRVLNLVKCISIVKRTLINYYTFSRSGHETCC